MEHPIHRSLRQPTDIGNIDFVSVLDSFDDGVIIADCQGKILYYNHAQAVIDDLDRTKVIGRKVTDIYQLSRRDQLDYALHPH